MGSEGWKLIFRTVGLPYLGYQPFPQNWWEVSTGGIFTIAGWPSSGQFMGLTVASPDAVSFLDLGSGVGKQLGEWSNQGV